MNQLGTRPVVAAALAATLFGATGTAAELGPADLSAVTAGAWRSALGAVVLVLVALVVRARLTVARSDRIWVLWGGVGVAGYQLAFFEAVARTGVAVGTLVTIAAGPVVAGLLDAGLNHRPPRRRWLVGVAIALVGVVTLSATGAEVDALGFGLAVLAGISFPLYGLAAQRLMTSRDPIGSIALVFAAGAILLLPVTLPTATQAFGSPSAAATVVFLGVVTLAAAYLLWGLALRLLPLSAVAAVTLLEPAVAAALAVLVLDEAATIRLLVGLTLVTIGVWTSSAADSHGSGRPGTLRNRSLTRGDS